MTTPNASLEECPSQLTDDQIEQFQKTGYLAFSGVLSSSEVKETCEALTRIGAELATDSKSIYTPLKSLGKSNQGGASFKRSDSTSMIQLEPGFNPTGCSVETIELNVRKYMWFCQEDEIFQKMVSPGSRLYGVVTSLIGNDPILFQEMALVKPPFVGVEKPWHQDNAYFCVTPLSQILGVWVALDDADAQNGCMHVIPGAHKDGAFKHHHGADCEIDPELLETDRATPVPVPAGGAMFFYGMLPHETPPNTSSLRRRALQFHFRGADTKIIDEAAYDALFVDRRGKSASCRAASRLGF